MLDDLAPAIGPGTMIMPLLNGMRHVDRLIERFGERAVLGGVCIVATTLDAEGRIGQLAEMQELAYGDGLADPLGCDAAVEHDRVSVAAVRRHFGSPRVPARAPVPGCRFRPEADGAEA